MAAESVFSRRSTATARPQRLATSIVHELVNLIVSGDVAEGVTLPPENTLAGEFGVSRTVMREAQKILEGRGLVTIRQGQGTVVNPRERWNLLDEDILDALIQHDDSLVVLESLVKIRAALESDMAHDAAVSATEDELARLDALLKELDDARTDSELYAALDVQFHDVVMQMSRNAVGRVVVNSVHGHARSSVRYGSAEQSLLLTSHRGHVAIAHSIRSRDADAARAAMREHILASWEERREHAG